jgi:uncharacterized protein (DUF2236 family)
MSSGPTLPTEEEIEEIILGPDSLVWQRFDDIRMYFGAGYALLLQVAHPTVGAGVRDHSTFEQDPWGRLLRTVDYGMLITYGGREAAAVGRRLRELHKSIRGTNPDGSTYTALEPEAYAWVHATLLEAGIAAHLRFVGPLSAAEIERLYAEYAPLGRLVGVRRGDLPEDWAGFRDYFETMVNDRLERHMTVDRVLHALTNPGPPPQLPPVVQRLWRLLRIPPAEALRISSIGMLPPVLRERFGVEWGLVSQAELRAMGAASRALGPILPRQLRNRGPSYLEWRAEEIRRGTLGPGGDGQLAAETPRPGPGGVIADRRLASGSR